MTPEALRRNEAITAALDALGWFKIPRTVDSVIGVYAEAHRETSRSLPYGATPKELADVLKASSDGHGGKGGHADPTAHAALHGEPDAVDPDETLPQIDHALGMIRDGAVEADHACADALGKDRWNPPEPGMGRQGMVFDAVARIEHLRPVLETALLAPGVDAAHIDGLIRIDVAETALWLRVKCSNIWAASRGDERPAEQERTLAPCKVCSPWRRNTIAGTSGLCDQCKDFRYHHKCLPTEPIVRRWEATGSNQTPPGMIIEAQAASRRKVKAS